MPGPILFCWTYILHSYPAFDHSLQQTIAIDRFHTLLAFQKMTLDHIYFRQYAYGTEKLTDHLIVETVFHIEPFLIGLD